MTDILLNEHMPTGEPSLVSSPVKMLVKHAGYFFFEGGRGESGVGL